MKILALESSAVACSAALCEDENLIAQSFQDNGLTHSVTLLPMAAHRSPLSREPPVDARRRAGRAQSPPGAALPKGIAR